METYSKAVRTTIPKLTDDPVSPYRVWYNDYLLSIQGSKNVLDIGKSLMWDYSGLFDGYTSIDINQSTNPDIVGDIFSSGIPDETYDTVLCNGMYESSEGTIEKMVAEVYRILKPKGRAVFGFIGDKHFQPDVLKYDGREVYGAFKKTKEVNMDGEYYFTICKK